MPELANMPTPFSPEWSATLEAIAAIAGLIATIVLLWLNRNLLKQNDRLIGSTAEAAAASVEVAKIETGREAQRVKPVLVMETDPSQDNKTLDLNAPTVYDVIVRNLGFGPALECHVIWTPDATGGVRLREVPEPFHIGAGERVVLHIEIPAASHFATPARATAPEVIYPSDDYSGTSSSVEVRAIRIIESGVGRLRLAFRDVYGRREAIAYDLVSNDRPQDSNRIRTRFLLHLAERASWLEFAGDER